MKLLWSRFALSDRDDIFSYIEAENPRAAVHVDEQIADTARRLLDFPDSGRPGRVAGTRELVVPRTPYVAAYLVEGETVRILRVLHGAQMWPDELANDD
ncbi:MULTISPECIES: type II toxin-antitoxin system RelE/ParE family toxin [unclassified Bradyrhizobium]